jgi:2,5-dichloro-2,5-cyclohexadiene-1,4-diol dehydrogenase 2
MKRLQDKIAIITGGANGIGAAISTLFAQQGAKVLITDIHEDAGQALAQTLRGSDCEAEFAALDVSNYDNWQTIKETAIRHYGGVSTLVNNAGMYHPSNLASESLEGWNQMLAVNQSSVFFGMKSMQAELAKSSGASIINISSLYGWVGSPNAISYHATKAAVRHMTKAAALELAASNVRVNSILPGQIQTQMLARITPEQALAISEATPLGRIGEPNDIAYGALYLASDEAKFVTGIDLLIDGGWAAG